MNSRRESSSQIYHDRMRRLLASAFVLFCALVLMLLLWDDYLAYGVWLVAGLLLGSLFLNTSGYRAIKKLLERHDIERIRSEIDLPEVTLHSITDAIITADIDGNVVYMNPVAERLTAWQLTEAKGMPFADVFKVVDENGSSCGRQVLCGPLDSGEVCSLENSPVLVAKDGRRIAITESAAPARDHMERIIGVVVVFQDVSNEREMTRLLAYQSTHDDLTGLYNRREFERRIQNIIDGDVEFDNHVLCYMDLNQFKVINDTCGHIAGDQLIKELAERLTSELRDEDTLARLGGDEFGILLQGCLPKDAIDVVSQLGDMINEYRFKWEEKTFEVGVSIGLVNIIAGQGSLSEVMSHADSACYVAKENPATYIHVYQPDDDALRKRKDEMEWVHRITRAYAENLFLLYAQEILPLIYTNRNEQRYEILIRMLDHEGNILLPMEYVAAAERYNMMSDLDRWVLYSAFKHVLHYLKRRHQDPSLPHKIFAINLSGQSVGDEKTCEFIKEQFELYPDLPSSLTFEITETAAIANISRAIRFITMFKERGVRFSLDDFGSGLSSFTYLKNIPVDYLKIDGEFVKDMSYDPVNYAMVGSINHIGHVMGIKTIAEHVSDENILEQLKDIGVDYGQGNWLSEPRRLSDIVGMEL